MKRHIPPMIFGVLALLFAVGLLLTNAVRFAVLAVVAAIFGFAEARSRRIALPEYPVPIAECIKKLLLLLCAGVCMFLMPPLTIESGAAWKYPFQRGFIGLYRNVKAPEWFPDFRGDIESGYHFRYMPSVMQGTGVFTVCFCTTPARAAEYAEQFAAQAQDTVRLRDCNTDSDGLYVDADFFADAPEAVIYVLEADYDFNHPHSSAVIVDAASGKIELSRYG